MPNIVLDSYAVMSYLKNEKGCDLVESYLKSDYELPVFISSVNFGEVYYSCINQFGIDHAENMKKWFLNTDIKICDLDLNLVIEAAKYKSKGNISYADCFALALAKQLGGKLLTGDLEFKQFEKEVEIEWV